MRRALPVYRTRPTRRVRRHPEQDLQIAIVEGLRAALPPSWIVAHAANGGYRTRSEGAIFKAMGVVAGFPDLMILGEVVQDGATAWFFELKADSSEPSDLQKDCHKKLRYLGFEVAVVRSWDDVLISCKQWRLPLRLAGFAALQQGGEYDV